MEDPSEIDFYLWLLQCAVLLFPTGVPASHAGIGKLNI